jgi:hypothetical protein
MSDVGDASIVGNVPPVPGMFPDWAAPRYWERIKVTVIAPHVATAAYWSTGHQHPATRLRRHSGFADTQKPLPGRSLMRSVSGVVMSVMVATARQHLRKRSCWERLQSNIRKRHIGGSIHAERVFKFGSILSPAGRWAYCQQPFL